jgi:hypothetical protein
MDSRVVAREIKNQIWPLLRREGFTDFSSKTAWRFIPEQIHVVNFQSFNSYLAQGLGCTTFSFALNLGIFFRAIPFDYPIRKGPDPSVKPQEYHCHFRHRLLKGIEQWVLPRRDTWYVEPDGSNLLEALSDARTKIEEEGLPWFGRFESMEQVFRLLMEQDQLPEVYATRSSPARKWMIGHVAKSLGKAEIAGPMITEAEAELEAIRVRVGSVGRGRKPRQ